jgi:hypothetical protein
MAFFLLVHVLPDKARVASTTRKAQVGGRVGCRVPGQSQIRTRSTTLAPSPMMCAHPNLPSFQAVHATKTTIARAIMTAAKTTLFVTITALLKILASIPAGAVVHAKSYGGSTAWY